MKQYLDLLKEIKEKGTYKAPARENMPGTYSLFGYQLRHNLGEGFPLLTTKKISFKNIVTELLWFLRGDTNIKFLIDNGCNIWNEDAYNYYVKVCSNHNRTPFTFDEFITFVKQDTDSSIKFVNTITPYKLGDCGKQYGWLWRNWEAGTNDGLGNYYPTGKNNCGYIDQIKELIDGLKKNPMSRRHIITAWNPATLDDMALNACHAFVQFNCRPLNTDESVSLALEKGLIDKITAISIIENFDYFVLDDLEKEGLPKYYLDCQMYQRSADVFLG